VAPFHQVKNRRKKSRIAAHFLDVRTLRFYGGRLALCPDGANAKAWQANYLLPALEKSKFLPCERRRTRRKVGLRERR